MAPDPTRTTDDHTEPDAPADRSVVGLTEAARGPFTLASLLDLDDDALAQPLSRVAPEEHRWEHLSLGVSQDDGALSSAELRSDVATELPANDVELIPGLDAPGAIEVPVYLAGRSLSDFLRNTPRALDAIAADTDALVDAPAALSHASANVAGRGESATVVTPAPPLAIAVTVVDRAHTKQDTSADGVSAPRDDAPRWGHGIAVFLESDNRLVRTLAGLVMAPGELTAAYLRGQRRRYFTPSVIGVAALVLFAIVTAIGGLRPRPDRALTIGTDRTAEALPGLVAAAPVNLAIDAPPDLMRDLAMTLDYVPLLWFPLMAFGVLAAVAALRTFDRQDDKGEVVFTCHFASWFVLWWGAAVPLLLLLSRVGFEYSAAWEGVERIRSYRNGQIEGLSPNWNALRAATISPAFHSWLVGVGLVPWAIIAYRRAFDASWLRAGIAGLLIAVVPLLLLSPFA